MVQCRWRAVFPAGHEPLRQGAERSENPVEISEFATQRIALGSRLYLELVFGKLSTVFGGEGDRRFGGELRNAVGRSFDSEFFHPVSQGVRMHAENLCGAIRALNHPVSLL